MSSGVPARLRRLAVALLCAAALAVTANSVLASGTVVSNPDGAGWSHRAPAFDYRPPRPLHARASL